MSDHTPVNDPARPDAFPAPDGVPPVSGPTGQSQPGPQFEPGAPLPPSAPDPYQQPPPPNAPGAYGQPNPYPAEPSPYAAAAPSPYGAVSADPNAGPERVGRGLALALVAIPAAMLLTAIIWRLGFIASISAFVLSALAVILYRRGSGGLVKKGIPGVIALILVGTVACFFSAVATDLFLYYGKQSPADQAALGTRGEFLSANVFYGPVLSSYGKDAALFGLFAVLGVFGTLRRLLRWGRKA